jgi:ribulose-phosphate 3-epimerase
VLQVDGGVTPTTAREVLAAGATCLIAGTAIFGKPDYARAIAEIRAAAPPARPNLSVSAG